MNTQQLLKAPTRRLWICAAFALVAVATVALWAANMDGDATQTAAMLGATIAVTAAATSGRASCRPAFPFRGRRPSER